MEILALILIAFVVIYFQGFIFERYVFKNLDYKCEFSVSEAHEGDEIFLIETVQNRKLLPVPWLKVNVYSSKWLEFAETRSVVSQENRHVTSSFFLKSKQKITRRWKLKCLKRGIFTIDNASLVSGDLMGINLASIAVNVNANLKVFPATISLEDKFVPVNFLQGDTIVKRWIVEDPFIVSGAREYTPRDPMSKIHWGATAKEGKFMVKKDDFTSQLSLTVILNIQSLENEYFGTVDKEVVEFGIKVAATILDRALKMGMPVRLATNGTANTGSNEMVFTGEAAGREHICGLLEILARLELKRIKDFGDFLNDVSSEIRNSDVILITPYVNPDIYANARKLKTSANRVSVYFLNEVEAKDCPRDIDIYLLSQSNYNI